MYRTKFKEVKAVIRFRSFKVVIFSAFLMVSGLAAKSDDYSWIRGFNYVPSYARNDIQIWMDYDANVIDKELRYAEKMKLNTVRIFLQYAVYKKDPEVFMERYENFLSLCDRHNIKAMIVVFDSCFGEYPDLENYRDKDWVANPGQNLIGSEFWPELEKYVSDVVGKHRNDKRIVMWDVMNEPFCTSRVNEPGGREKIWTFLEHFLDVVGNEDPTHPRTVGYMSSSTLPRLIDKLDVIAFHNYSGDMELFRKDIKYVKSLGAEHSKPVIINEVAHRGSGQQFWKFMPVLKEERIGFCFWELMLGKTQFSRGNNPIQGVVYPDGKCRNLREIASIMGIAEKEVEKIFPEAPLPKVTEGGITYTGFWTRWTGQGPQESFLYYASDFACKAEFTFIGSQIYLVHKVGPDCGIANILIDDKPAAIPQIDTFSSKVEWNHQTLLAKNLSDDEHNVVIEVTGDKNPDSSNTHIQIVGFGTEQLTSTETIGNRWPEEKALDWYKKQLWLVGFNYVPSTACNTTEWWQRETFDTETIDRELSWAQNVGYNTARAFIQYIVWKDDAEGFKKRFEKFLSLAAKHGISVMPVLFDDCAFGQPTQLNPFLGKQREPIPGMILPSWTPSPGLKLATDPNEFPVLKKYVQDMLTSFGKDERIVMWDLYNEPVNAVRGTIPLVKAAFSWAREVNPQQPVTISVWDNNKVLNDILLANSDIISFHLYSDCNGVKGRIADLKKYGRPVVCTEWMARIMGSSFDTELPLFKKEKVGCYAWGLVNGRTQCQFPWWNKPGGEVDPEAGWFHDIFHTDGTPYRPEEIEAIRKYTADKNIWDTNEKK
jgi:endo-1,4-beta-mannosidase